MVKQKYQQRFEQILNSETIKRVFELNGGKDIPVFKGYRVTRHTSEFKKGQDYGRVEQNPNNTFYPKDSLGYLLTLGPSTNIEGYNIVKLDLETYELAFTPEGLKHQIIHEYRKGSRFGPGHDKDYLKRLHKEILNPTFLTDGDGLLLNREIYSFPNDLDTGLDAIVYRSRLSERKIVNELKDLEKYCLKGKDFTPKTVNSFRTLNVFGFEKGKEGTASKLNLSFAVQTHSIEIK